MAATGYCQRQFSASTSLEGGSDGTSKKASARAYGGAPSLRHEGHGKKKRKTRAAIIHKPLTQDNDETMLVLSVFVRYLHYASLGV